MFRKGVEMRSNHTDWFAEECSELGALETVDPEAFQGNEDVPQALCNFVLALALVFNDLRDLYLASILIQECKPSGLPQKARPWGYYSGLNLHVLRLIMSTIHELLNLIKAHESELNHPLFRKVVRSLPKPQRSDWDQVVRVGLGKTSTDERLGKLLLKVRHKMVFHYDPKAVSNGYKNHFWEQRLDTRAYLSRGNSMQGSRFYFADAAVEGLLREFGGNQSAEIAQGFQRLLDNVGQPLILIITAFIQKRGFAFRSEAEPRLRVGS